MAEVKPNADKKDKVEGAQSSVDAAAKASENATGAGPAEVTKPPAAAPQIEVGVNKVEVILAADHKTFIGGKWYDFKAGVKKEVSKDVFRCLKEAGLVKITY